MLSSPQRSFGILGLGSYLPEGRITNRELARSLGVSEAWIVSRTGIHERRVARPEQATSDLATQAGIRALGDARVEPSELDLIIVATSTPDWIQPATACAVQDKMGLYGIPAFDVAAAGTGFVYALAVAVSMVQFSPSLGSALVVGAETQSRIVDWQDRTSCAWYGDGAGAAVIGPVPEGFGVLSASLSANGALTSAVAIPAGGTRLAPSPETFARRQHYVRVDGRELRRYATETLPEVMRGSLAEAGVGPDDVDLAVCQGPNPALLASCMEAAGVDPSKAHFSVERYGNTAAASVPINLHEARAAGRLGRGAVVVLAAVGGGMTAGSVVLRWY